MTTVLHIKDLSVSIANKQVCRRLILSVNSGQCWGILGKNGIGKTTLMNTLAGLRVADAGEVYLNGKTRAQYTARQWAQQCGVLFQDYKDAFPSTVLETTLIGRHPHLSQWQWESDRDIDIARQALKQVGLDGLEQRHVDTLSGGERRRLAIATLLAQQPQLFFLDEPANHLDIHFQISLLEIFRQHAQEQDKSVIMVLHDVNLAERYCDQVLLLLGNGEYLAGAASELLQPDILSSVYSHPMQMHRTETGRIFIPG